MDRKKLRELIPYGYNKIIANKAGVTTNAVSMYLRGKNNSAKIELAALEVVADLNDKRKELLARLA